MLLRQAARQAQLGDLQGLRGGWLQSPCSAGAAELCITCCGVHADALAGMPGADQDAVLLCEPSSQKVLLS